MKIGHHRGYPVGEDGLGIPSHPHHTALDVAMGVDEAGGEKFPLEVYYLPGGILPEAHYHPLGDGDCLRFKCSREDIDELDVLQKEINFLVTCG